ncbi:tRNA-5-carboxymethylaminomethyl-2-thiouridine(34)synthesis protein MnmE, partial [hydrothermal vent metagenome]
MNLEDTIVAISTPSGEGGIGIIRLSGKDAINIASRIFCSPNGKSPAKTRSHTILYGYITNPENLTPVDEVLLSVMRAPHSYTREDVVEINCHGGMLPLRKVLELTAKEGARLAEPGEF